MTLKNSRDVLSSGDVLEGSSLDHRKDRQDHRKGGRRRGRIVLPLLVVCAVVAAIMATDYRMTHGEIYRGVSAGGVPVAG